MQNTKTNETRAMRIALAIAEWLGHALGVLIVGGMLVFVHATAGFEMAALLGIAQITVTVTLIHSAIKEKR